jgi:hypothetical protein
MRRVRTVIVTAAVLVAGLLGCPPASAVTVAWDTLIPRAVGSSPAGAVSVGDATFLVFDAGDVCSVARLDAAGTIEWIRDIGMAQTSLNCETIATDGGSLFVGMSAIGSLDGMPAEPGWDVYLRKLTLDGGVVWTRSWGTAHSEFVWDVAVGGGGIYLTGDDIDLDTHEEDAFVRRYDLDGAVSWTRYVRRAGPDVFIAAAAGDTGVDVAWHDFSGGGGAWIRHYDPDGSVAWTSPTLEGYTELLDLVRTDAGLFASGDTSATLGRRSFGGFDAVVASIDPATGVFLWIRQFGSAGPDLGTAVAVGPAGVYVAGSTGGSIGRFENHGGYDAFTRSYPFEGRRRWTRQFGTHRGDEASAVLVDAAGVVVIGGTDGNFGTGHVEDVATFVRRWVPA